jgi:hypothetical protein
MKIAANENGRIYPSKFRLKYFLIIFLESGKIGILNWIKALLTKSHAFNRSH